jgi:hypothetical protein
MSGLDVFGWAGRWLSAAGSVRRPGVRVGGQGLDRRRQLAAREVGERHLLEDAT